MASHLCCLCLNVSSSTLTLDNYSVRATENWEGYQSEENTSLFLYSWSSTYGCWMCCWRCTRCSQRRISLYIINSCCNINCLPVSMNTVLADDRPFHYYVENTVHAKRDLHNRPSKLMKHIQTFSLYYYIQHSLMPLKLLTIKLDCWPFCWRQ